jgi:hypothetical protein
MHLLKNHYYIRKEKIIYSIYSNRNSYKKLTSYIHLIKKKLNVYEDNNCINFIKISHLKLLISLTSILLLCLSIRKSLSANTTDP